MRLMRIYYIRHYAFLAYDSNIKVHVYHLIIPLHGCLWFELSFIHGLNPVYLIAMAVCWKPLCTLIDVPVLFETSPLRRAPARQNCRGRSHGIVVKENR